MSFSFDQWRELTKRERGHTLKDPIGKALALLAGGMNTYGRWPQPGRSEAEQKLAMKQMEAIALTYSVGCAHLWQISPDIVKATAQAYLEGEVTIFQNGSQVKPQSFPDVHEFRDACLQTFYRLYRTRATGQKVLEDGAVVLTTVLEPRSAPVADAPALEAPMSAEQLEAARQKITRLFGSQAPALAQRQEKSA